MTDDAEDEDRPRARPRRLWPWLLGATVLVVGWLALAGLTLLDAKADAEAGRDRLQALRSAPEPADALLNGGAGELRLAAADFQSARRGVRSPLVSPLRALPVVGRQLRAFDSMASSAGRVAASGGGALDRIDDRISAGSAAGGERVALMREIADATAEVQTVLADVDLGPSEALVGPLADARAEFAEELGEVREVVDNARAVADGLLPMFEGPSRYLVLGANNAEMQVGGGMPLSIGVLEITDGQLVLPDMRPSAELVLDTPVPVDPDVASRWAFSEPGIDFRSLGRTPRFDVTGEQAARMWEAAGLGTVDGVLLVDPVVLSVLLGASGPITVGDTTYAAENVLDELLKNQYAAFDDVSARQDRLSEVASAAVDALDGGGFDVAQLAADLADAAGSRHILAWSRHPGQQAAWEAAGITGELPDDALFVGLYSVGGVKLDPYIDVAADLVHDGGEVSVQITVTNASPEGLPLYVEGPIGDGEEGQYEALLVVSIPGFAEGGIVDEQTEQVSGADGNTVVVASRLLVLRGEGAERTVRFTLPDDAHRVTVLPTGRIPPIDWTEGGVPLDVSTARHVTW